ncbi:MAG: CoA transferase [Chloroflexi bacterium]|nr:CoA transferase [Chloroflexota bacterium]
MKHALEGIRVVDLTGYIAGSYAPTLLADLGAQVVKIESFLGDPFRDMAGSFLTWNKGKRGIVVDLKQAEGQEIVHKMVREADIVVENFRPGVAKRLGVDYETLQAIKPDIIYCSVTGYGQGGPFRDKAAFDPMLQAASGVTGSQSGYGNPPTYLAIAVCDYSAAMLACWGMVMGLYVRARTGRGQRLETSLCNAAVAVRSGTFFVCDGDLIEEEGGIDFLGRDATYRLYETAERWLFIACEDEASWQALCRELGQHDLLKDERFASAEKRAECSDELSAILEPIFRQRPAREWLPILDTAGIPCAGVKSSREILHDPLMLDNDMVIEFDHPTYGRLRELGQVIRFSETPGKQWRPAPVLGQHTEEVLQELGYSTEGIARLLEARVVGGPGAGRR